MRSFVDDDGLWNVEAAGGRLGDRVIAPDTIGPLVEAPRLLLRWVEAEADAHGAGSTEYLQLQAGWIVFTIRRYRWQADAGGPIIDYETVMRDAARDEFVNPEPPPWVEPERWSRDGWRIL
jgi:hypothetical protein